jgi:hypothetical protein
MYRVDRPVLKRKRAREETPTERRQTQIDEVWMRADKERKEKPGRDVHIHNEAQREDERTERDERDRRDVDTRQYDG